MRRSGKRSSALTLPTAVLVAAATALTLPSAAIAASATNGDFEVGSLAGWAATGGTSAVITTASPHTGGYAAEVRRRSSSGAAGITDVDQFTQVPGGSVCTATAWVKGPSGRKATIKWFALNGTTKVTTVAKTLTFDGSWQETAVATLTMPSTASTADLQVIAPSFPLNQTWYVDDVTASCGTASPPPPPPPPPGPGMVGHWAFDEPEPMPAQAIDSSGRGNTGTNHNIQAADGAYTFNGSDSRVVVPDSSTLDPGGANFSFGATLQMATPPSPEGETFDILRKGLAPTPGGNYKLEVKNVNGKALARCVVKDGQKVAAIRQGGPDLADSAQHEVSCHRVGNGVSLVIDGVTVGTKTVTALGAIANATDLAIGAKAEGTAGTGFDWFLGKIYDAWVRIDA